MTFGDKGYQHRFYTVPKIRNRHINEFVNQQSSLNQKFRNFSKYEPTFSPQIMKQSYIKLMQNGIKSRLVTKDQVGYEGLKFQKDVINRYCGNDYKKDSQMLQKFRKQAQQNKNRKFSHVRKSTLPDINRLNNYPSDINRLNHYQYQNNQNIFKAEQTYNKNLLSYIPITYSPQNYKNNYRRYPQNQQNIFAYPHTTKITYPMNQQYIIRNPQNYYGLPNVKTDRNPAENQKTTRSINLTKQVYDQQERNNVQPFRTIQFQQQQQREQANTSERTNNISQGNNSPIYKYNNARMDKKAKGSKNQNNLHQQKLKMKNKFLQKKYDKIKQKLMQKSLILSHHQKIQQQRQQIQSNRKFDQKIQNLSQMIGSIGDKLKKSHQQIISNINIKIKPNQEVQINLNKQADQINLKKQTSQRQSKNQTQINLLNTERFKNQSVKNNMNAKQDPKNKKYTQTQQEQYQKFIQKNKSEHLKPKIKYTFQKDNHKTYFDPLKLIKNRIKEKFYLENLANYSSPKRNQQKPSNTTKNIPQTDKKQNQSRHKRNKTQPA